MFLNNLSKVESRFSNEKQPPYHHHHQKQTHTKKRTYFNDSGNDSRFKCDPGMGPLASECKRMCEPHVSKARQLLGLLNFCLLSRAESEMERIDLLSAGGALPWAGPLARSLARLPCSRLSPSSSPPPPPSSSSPTSVSLSLCVAALLQLTLVLPLLGEVRSSGC